MNQLLIGQEIIDIGLEGTSPILKFNKWGGECNIRLLANLTGFHLKPDANKIDAESDNILIRYLPAREGFSECGGLDMIITFTARPTSNRILFDLDAKNTIMYHQPSLKERIKVGERQGRHIVASVTDTEAKSNSGILLTEAPLHAINSVAFYHSSKSHLIKSVADGEKYKIGKIGQLFSYPFASWSIEGSKLVFTINQGLLDTATYPLILRPYGDTFGYVTAGSENTSGNTDIFVSGCESFTGVAGSGVTFHISTRDSTQDGYIQGAVYDNSSPEALVANAYTAGIAVTVNAQHWVSGAFVGVATFAAATYWLCSNRDTDEVRDYFDWTSGGATYENQAYGTWPATIAMGHDWTARKFSHYVTVTPSAAAYIPKVIFL